MTHFNHDWDTTKTPAVPVSVGDRYYAQDLNDDFNYLKHLPYEILLQGRSRGVMIAPSDTWNNNTNSLTLSGGFGAILQDCIELDPNEDFVIPPKTQSSPRYERVSFTDTTLVIPTDNTIRYIVATPTKRSLLQRAKTLFTEQYASRVRYDGVISIQNTVPTVGQILVGLCCNKEYCLLADNDPNQCKDNIILKKWFGENRITQDFVSILQSYYNTSITSIETKISINNVSGRGIYNGTFSNCSITIDTVSSNSYGISGTFNNCSITIGTVSYRGISDGTFNNCSITIDTVSSNSYGISNGTFSNCSITIDTVNGDYGIYNGTFNNCSITIDTVSSGGDGTYVGTYSNCTITIDTVSSDSYGISISTFHNCNITIGTVSYRGISNGTCTNCTIIIGTVNSNGHGIYNGTYSNCSIRIGTVNGTASRIGYGISGTFNSCNITINTVSSNGYGIIVGTWSNCSITIDTVSSNGYGTNNGTFSNCSIRIGIVNGGYGIYNGTLNNCSIRIGTVKGNGHGIYNDIKVTFNTCIIIIDTVNSGDGINNNSKVAFYLTRIECTAVIDLSNTNGKLNVLNDTVFPAS